MFTSLLLVVVVAASMSLTLSRSRRATDAAERDEVCRAAESEIFRLAATMRESADWRTALNSGQFSARRDSLVASVFGPITVRHSFTDTDGDLTDGETDSVELLVHAVSANAEMAIAVQLEWDPGPLDFLSHAVSAEDDIRIKSGGSLACERSVRTGDDCRIDNNCILATPTLQYHDELTGYLRGDSIVAGQVPLHDLVAGYQLVGTEIDLGSLPFSNGAYQIQGCLLSPSDNPYGTADAAGIYFIDADGSKIDISNCRIAATLAIADCNKVNISGGVVWEYPINADAILVTDGEITVEDLEANLDESVLGVNFNPASTPYRVDVSNATMTDVMPSVLRGVIQTSQDLYFKQDGQEPLRIFGCLACSKLQVAGDVRIFPLDEIYENPPPQLSSTVPMRFVHGSWRRAATP